MEKRHLIEATCPECRGPLTEIEDDGIIEYECLVGHRYSLQGVLRAHYETEERALWAAVVGLEEAQRLVQAVSAHLQPEMVGNLQRDAEGKQQQAHEVRRVLNELRGYNLGAGQKVP